MRGRPPVTGGPVTDCATGVVAGEDLMLRITSNLEHSDTLPTLQRSAWLKCPRPYEVGRKPLLLQNKVLPWSFGYPGLRDIRS